jgi:hypothetical protein
VADRSSRSIPESRLVSISIQIKHLNIGLFPIFLVLVAVSHAHATFMGSQLTTGSVNHGVDPSLLFDSFLFDDLRVLCSSYIDKLLYVCVQCRKILTE